MVANNPSGFSPTSVGAIVLAIIVLAGLLSGPLRVSEETPRQTIPDDSPTPVAPKISPLPTELESETNNNIPFIEIEPAPPPDNWHQLSNDQKIRLNPYNCDLTTQIMWSDGSCHDINRDF